MKINEMQRRAVMHKDGPMLVLAGPGSGKTLVITERTKYLIKKYRIPENNILVVTFTKAAADEMKQRFLSGMEAKRTTVCFGTFHSVFYMILRHAYNLSPGNIISEEGRFSCLREVVTKAGLHYEDEKELITELLSEISMVKAARIQPENYYSINCSDELFRIIYAEYKRLLNKARLMDFDDILIYCLELLDKRADILAMWQDKFRYILIDEFQDINMLQYDIIRRLSKPLNNLFVVGDDDQSIYKFRGAKPEIMLDFPKDYKGCPILLLDKNYRSAPDIIAAAGRLISFNEKRFCKEARPVLGPAGKVYVMEFNTMTDQNLRLVDEILKLKNSGMLYSEIAVLVRTNMGLGPIVNKLMEYNIPFIMKDSLPNMYDHWIAADLTAYMRIALGSWERSLFLRIINKPKRYIGRECLSSSTVDIKELLKWYEDKEWMINRIEQLEYDLKVLSRMGPYAAINYIRKGIGYEEYLKEYASQRNMDAEELLEILDQLQENTRGFRTIKEWFSHMEAYKKELDRQSAKSRNDRKDCVMLATMHGAKGLEFTSVFIVDASEGITPHKKAALPSDIEEERRLFYVAMTRAREYLYIFSAGERYNKLMYKSRFITEILPNSDDA